MNINKKIFAMVLALVMVFGLLMPISVVATPTFSWTGEWDTNWGRMNLTQTGNTVTGTYVHQQGTIFGTVLGNRLQGTWHQTGNNRSGYIDFIMSDDGMSFHGYWRWDDETARRIWGHTNWEVWEGSIRLTEVIIIEPTPQQLVNLGTITWLPFRGYPGGGTIVVSPGGGELLDNGWTRTRVEQNSTVTITAIADNGFEFRGWYRDQV